MTMRTLDLQRARAVVQSMAQSHPPLLVAGADATLVAILQQPLYYLSLLSLLPPPHPLLVLPQTLQCRWRSSPSAELSELLQSNLWLSPTIVRLLGKRQCAIAAAATAVGANTNICLRIVIIAIIAPVTLLLLPQSRVLTAPVV